jgi:hypothetical protein
MSDVEADRDLRDTDGERGFVEAELERIWRTAPGFVSALATVDHKIIGRRYIATAFVFLALGGVLALLL